MKNKHIFFTLLLFSSIVLSGCEDEDPVPVPLPDNLNGVFVVNEGAFLQGNGSITFISSDSASITPDIYSAVNNVPLGDVVQSMQLFRSKGYIAVNNSQKLVVVDMVDFKRQATITVGSPRYFTGITGTKGYVSDWSDSTVKIIDLQSNVITGSIKCGNGPDQMIQSDEELFVCNSGGFGTDSTITVVNIPGDSVFTTFTVGVNPNSIVKDAGNRIWILCSGTLGPDFIPNTADDIGGKLVQIDQINFTVLKSFSFAQGEHPVKMQIDGSGHYLYYLLGSSNYTGVVCRMNIGDNSLPPAPLINREFYGLGIHPGTDQIYGGVPSFSLDSYVLRYTNTGSLVDSVNVGIGPNGFAFN